jgi:hypothetical protein
MFRARSPLALTSGRMADWLQGYEALSEERKVNIQRWIHLNKFIARTLRVDERAWFEDYVGGAMQAPFDYGFMADTAPEVSGHEAIGSGETFSRGLEPGAMVGPRVPLRAKNNMGRLSPQLQDTLAGLLERGEPSSVSLIPADVAQLQKIFPSAKGLAKLKRPDFRSVRIERDPVNDDVMMSAGQTELLRVNLLEFAAVMSRALV